MYLKFNTILWFSYSTGRQYIWLFYDLVTAYSEDGYKISLAKRKQIFARNGMSDILKVWYTHQRFSGLLGAINALWTHFDLTRVQRFQAIVCCVNFSFNCVYSR